MAVLLLAGLPPRPARAGGQTGAASELARALQAELAFYPNAIVLTAVSADCSAASDPSGAACIVTQTDEQTAELGLAEFSVQYPGAVPARDVLGRTADGSWQPWFETQQRVLYQLLTLPGSMIVCAEAGLVNVRSSPSADASSVAVLTRGTAVSAERFLLLKPGSLQPGAPPPAPDSGWYQISAPADGWINSRAVTDAALGSCTWHDALDSLS